MWLTCKVFDCLPFKFYCKVSTWCMVLSKLLVNFIKFLISNNAKVYKQGTNYRIFLVDNSKGIYWYVVHLYITRIFLLYNKEMYNTLFSVTSNTYMQNKHELHFCRPRFKPCCPRYERGFHFLLCCSERRGITALEKWHALDFENWANNMHYCKSSERFCLKCEFFFTCIQQIYSLVSLHWTCLNPPASTGILSLYGTNKQHKKIPLHTWEY